MAYNFHAPSSSYRKPHNEELHSPLNASRELPSNADFSQPVLGNNLAQHIPTASSHPYTRASGSQMSRQSTEVILKTSPHFMLMAAQNQAYTDLFDKYLHAKCQLQAQENLVTELKEELKEARNLTKITLSSHSRNDDSADDRAPKPSIKLPLERQEDYPNVRFWCQADWMDFESRAKNRNEQIDKLYFLSDKSGLTISKARRDEMKEAAKIAFNELFYRRIDPQTWGKRIEHAFQYISVTLRTRFPEFRWCEGDWKVQEFAKIRYPHWTRHYRDRGMLTHAKPSVGKHRTDESNASACKPKKRRLNKPPAPEKEVIEIESDELLSSHRYTPAEESSSASSPPHLSSALSPAPDVPPSSSTRLGTSAPTPPFSASSSAASGQELAAAISHLEPVQNSISTEPSSSTTTSEAAPTTTNPISTPSPMATATPLPVSSAPLSPHVINPVTEITPRQTTLTIEPASSIRARSSQSSVSAPNGAAVRGAKVTRRSRFNPLNGPTVPKPTFEVPPPTTTIPSVPAVGQPKPKKGKIMVPSKTSLTARNLYAIDYEKDHREDPVTAAEFKKIYDNLDAETLKRYKLLSKEKKAAMKALPVAISS